MMQLFSLCKILLQIMRTDYFPMILLVSLIEFWHMTKHSIIQAPSRVNLLFVYAKNKGANQVLSNCAADQGLCFRFI